MISGLKQYQMSLAITPAIIYCVIGALLVMFFEVHLLLNMWMEVLFFFVVLGSTTVYKTARDIWFSVPYFYHGKRVLLSEEAHHAFAKEAHPFIQSFTMATGIAIILVSSLLAMLGIWSFDNNYSLLWGGVVALPVSLGLASYRLSAIFFARYLNKVLNSVKAVKCSFNRLFWQKFMLPELFIFLALNIAVVAPFLGGIEGKAMTGSLHTLVFILCFVFVSTLFLLLNAREQPISQLTGLVFSELVTLVGLDKLSKISGPRGERWTIQSFPFWRWFSAISIVQLLFSWLAFKMFDKNGALYFVILSECVWGVSYLYLRHRTLTRVLSAVVSYYRQHPHFYNVSQLHNTLRLPRELVV